MVLICDISQIQFKTKSMDNSNAYKTLPREKDGLQALSLRNFYVAKTAQFSRIKPHNSVALNCDISQIQNKIFLWTIQMPSKTLPREKDKLQALS